MDKSTIFFAIFTVVVIFIMLRGGGGMDVTEARALVKDGALLVDVRSPGEFRMGHIDGAVNIPLSEVGARLKEFGEKDGQIVLYCRSGNRSGQAMRMLQSAGYTGVHNLGAMSRW